MPKHNHRAKTSAPAVEPSAIEGRCIFEMTIAAVIADVLIAMYELSGVPSIGGIYFPGEMTVLNNFRSKLTGVDVCDLQDAHPDIPYHQICEDTLTWAKRYVGLENIDLHAHHGMVIDAEQS